EINRPFDLSTAPLLRALIIRCSDSEHLLLLNMHHIISDEWSLKILFKELGEFYEHFSAGKMIALPELAIQYVDYAVWQRDRLKGELLEQQLSYWKKQFAGQPPLTELPTRWPRKAAPSFRGAVACRRLRPQLIQEVEALARNQRATSFIVLLTAFKALLYRYTG